MSGYRVRPGGTVSPGGDVEMNAGLAVTRLLVRNTGDHPVHVTSHYHFFEANKRLLFDRGLAFGKRLDVPSGGSVRWEPGETREVGLIGFGGRREIFGFNRLTDGQLDESTKARAVEKARALGYLDSAAPTEEV